jgi:aminotransferase
MPDSLLTSAALRTARRTHGFTESVIREMTRVAKEHGAVNLAQGFPDFACPDVLKEAATAAVRADVNQYAVTWGAPRLRAALVEKYRRWYGMEIEGDRQLVVTCGATEAMASVLLALVDPDEEVIVPEPYYENYGPGTVLCGSRPVFVKLDPPDFRLDADRLRALVTPRTRAIVVNTPNNPTGRVFDRGELEAVASVCREHDLLAITDEIYEHIYYEGEHVCLATLDGMQGRTIVVSGASKTFSVTGWRIGWVVAPPELAGAIRKVHDFLTVGAPAPLQEGVAAALETLGDEYYRTLAAEYRERRDVLIPALQRVGFACRAPQGAYYVLADFSGLSSADDHRFALDLTRDAGVTAVPGSSFFRSGGGRNLLRFTFCKRMETLHEAGDRLLRFAGAGG